MSATIQQKAEDYFHTLNEPSQQSTAHKKQCNQNDNANNRQYSHLYFSISLLSDVATILPHVNIAVCIYLNIFSVGRQQQIQDMVAIEFRHPTPTATAIRTPLQFLVIIRINPVYERSYSHLICHNRCMYSICHLSDSCDPKSKACSYCFLFLIIMTSRNSMAPLRR